jgi:hypothetical protein
VRSRYEAGDDLDVDTPAELLSPRFQRKGTTRFTHVIGSFGVGAEFES